MLANIVSVALVGFGISGPTPVASAVGIERLELGRWTAAQAADTAQVLLSLAERLEHPQARATIIRPAGENVPDLIIVIAATTPEDLEQAVRMLVAARHAFGTSMEREMRAHVPPASGPSTNPDALREATQHLSEVQGGEAIDIPGIGPVKAIMVTVRDTSEPAEQGHTGH